MKARRLVGAVLLAAIGAAFALAVWAAVHGNDTDEATPATVTERTTTTTAPRPDPVEHPEAAELYDIVNASGTLTVHATYDVKVTAKPDATITQELWRKGDSVRQDTTLQDATGMSKIALIHTAERTVLCQQPPGGQYTCGLVAPNQASSFDAVRTTLLSRLGQQDPEVRDDTIAGRAVRCFTVSAEESSELCATKDGLLVRIAAQEGSFELVTAEPTVDDSAFTPPATPGAS